MPWRHAVGVLAGGACFAAWHRTWRRVAGARYLEESLEVERGRLRLLREVFEEEEVEEPPGFMPHRA